MKKNIMLLVLMTSISCNGMYKVRRTFFRRSAIGVTVATGMWWYWYNQKLELDAAYVNALDKEIVAQFYTKNPHAKNKVYQALQEEARKGDVFWYDVFPHEELRTRGGVDSKFPTLHDSKATECNLYYNMDPKTKKYFIEHYDCTTRLSRGLIKKCLQESIKEGRIE